MPESEQPNTQSDAAKADTGLKSLGDFSKLSAVDMAKELGSKDYSQYKAPAEDQANVDSETSDENSNVEADSTNEQTSNETDESTTTKETEDSSTDSDPAPSKTDKQKNTESAEERLSKLEKNYKELQAEFTRRSQKLKEYEDNASKSTESKENKVPEKESRLAQLRKKDPEAANALEQIIREEAEKIVSERVKPVEEQVTLRRRQENASKFSKASEDFKTSALAELEPQLVDIINENPSEWQRVIWEDENAFDKLLKELRSRHTIEVADLLRKADKSANASSTKKERLKDSQVGTKTKVTQPTKDVMSSDEFRKLSAAEMEKRLPRVRG